MRKGIKIAHMRDTPIYIYQNSVTARYILERDITLLHTEPFKFKS